MIKNNNMLKVRSLNKLFPDGNGYTLNVLKDVSFSVSSGEFALIMGPSGSGKTTLLSIIGCLLPASSGSVNIIGQDVMSLNQSKLSKFRLANIGFVFQSFKLLNALKVIDNVSLVLKLSGTKEEQAREKAFKVLQETGISHKADCYPEKLSGGEKQRVAVARALVSDPGVILADEPTGSLDSVSGKIIAEILIKTAKEKNKTVIVVSHDERIRNYADRLFHIEDGILEERANGN